MTNARAIFWLLLATLLSGAANLLLSWRAPATRTMQRHPTLLDPSDRPTSVEIVRPGAPRTVLRKEGLWTLAQPYSGSVDERVVLRLLDALASTPVEDSLTDDELLKLGRTRADFGLDAPSLKLTVSGGAEAVELSFGGWTPASNGVYVAMSGSDSVMVVPVSVREAADLRADAFRERNVFPYEPEFVIGFDLRKAGETPLSFVRDGMEWKVGAKTASAVKVRDFLSRLTAANAIDFFWPVGATNEEATVSEARLVGYGLDGGGALAVTLRCRDGVDRRILIGNDVGDDRSYALVHDGSAIVSVDVALKAAALAGTHSFVDTRLFPLDESSVSSFTLTDGKTAYVLARGSEGAWRLDAPVSAVADPRLSSLLLNRILALTPADLASEGLRVSVSTNRAPYVVSKQAVLGGSRLEDLRSSEILRIDAALVKRLVSTPGRRVEDAASIVYSRERRAWSAEREENQKRVVDAEAVETLLSALCPLKAERIATLSAAAADLSRYGLEKPSHTLSVDQERRGAVRRNIFIGARTKEGRYATVGSAEAIFVISEKTAEALSAPLFKD